jgi:hypothetical protein
MTSEAVLRRMRALTLPSVLFTTGLVGHAAAGGVTPATSVLVPLFVLTVVAVAQFVGAPTSPARSMALLVGGQGLLHAALQLLSGTGTTTTTVVGAAAGMATVSSSASSHLMMHQQGVAASHGFVMSQTSGAHLVMLLAHLAAAVVVGLWLAAGERAFSTLLALTSRPVVEAWQTVTAAGRRPTGAVVVRCPRLLPGWGWPAAVSSLVWVAGVVSRRGPPGTASPEAHAYAAVSMV